MGDPGTRPLLRGIELRYVLTVALLDGNREVTIPELARVIGECGFRVGGRPSKTISDALRWEVGKGRVLRLGRARYGPGRLPRSTEWWIRRRVASLAR
jgi:hypothetical protein